MCDSGPPSEGRLFKRNIPECGGATIYWEGCLGFQETEKWPREKWEEKDCVNTGGQSRREERAGNGSWASPSPRLQTIFKKAILRNDFQDRINFKSSSIKGRSISRR